eukprot:COSAG03_NODE_17958_length_364_cov_7.430189_1_plen_26_part_10
MTGENDWGLNFTQSPCTDLIALDPRA